MKLKILYYKQFIYRLFYLKTIILVNCIIHDNRLLFPIAISFQLQFKSEANTLDLVMSNDNFVVFDLVVAASFANSDHCSIEFKLVLNNSSASENHSKYDFRNAVWDAITSTLSMVDWNDQLEDDCYNLPQQFAKFYDVVHEAIDRHVPVVCHSNNHS